MFRVTPLAVPDVRRAHLPALDDVRASPAVRLFADRIGGTAAPRDDWMAIAEICRRLDGLPLAIELAAARANVLSPREIAARLDDRFALLRGRNGEERHATLGEMIAWSDSLLEPAERELFHRLGIFAGRFTLAAVKAICAHGRDEITLLDELGGLIDKSLVVSERFDDVQRFRLLDSMRGYLDERFSDVRDALANVHAAYYLETARAYAKDVSNGATFAALHDLDDCRAALTWALRDGKRSRTWSDAGRRRERHVFTARAVARRVGVDGARRFRMRPSTRSPQACGTRARSSTTA